MGELSLKEHQEKESPLRSFFSISPPLTFLLDNDIFNPYTIAMDPELKRLLSGVIAKNAHGFLWNN
jgi:hypothetical protein